MGTLRAILEEMGKTLPEFEFSPYGIDALVDRYFVPVHGGRREEYVQFTVAKAVERIHQGPQQIVRGEGELPTEHPPPDGPEGGRWLWWQGKRHEVRSRKVYALVPHFWGRDSASFDALMGAGGAVWDDAVSTQTVASLCNKVKTALPPNFPWRLSVNSRSRTVTKVQTSG